jgi:hypothetical protein
MIDLRLPAAVISRELVDEQQRVSVALFLDVQTDTIIGDEESHRPYHAG